MQIDLSSIPIKDKNQYRLKENTYRSDFGSRTRYNIKTRTKLPII